MHLTSSCARDLNASVVERGERVRHTVIVPPRDLDLFGVLGGDRTSIRSVDEFLPGLHRLPRNYWLNPRRPWLPVRGWVAQQLVKLAAAAASRSDLVLMVDSDIVFVPAVRRRDVHLGIGTAGVLPADDAVDDRLPRHVLWHEAARRLLGLGTRSTTPLPDYVSCPCVWEPSVVAVTPRPHRGRRVRTLAAGGGRRSRTSRR